MIVPGFSQNVLLVYLRFKVLPYMNIDGSLSYRIPRGLKSLIL